MCCSGAQNLCQLGLAHFALGHPNQGNHHGDLQNKAVYSPGEYIQTTESGEEWVGEDDI